MARHIVEYKMHRHNGCKVHPSFIEEGGCFQTIVEGEIKLIGVTFDDLDTYIPKSDLDILTNQQFIDIIKALDYGVDEDNMMSEEEKETMADNWLEEQGF